MWSHGPFTADRTKAVISATTTVAATAAMTSVPRRGRTCIATSWNSIRALPTTNTWSSCVRVSRSKCSPSFDGSVPSVNCRELVRLSILFRFVCVCLSLVVGVQYSESGPSETPKNGRTTAERAEISECCWPSRMRVARVSSSSTVKRLIRFARVHSVDANFLPLGL